MPIGLGWIELRNWMKTDLWEKGTSLEKNNYSLSLSRREFSLLYNPPSNIYVEMRSTIWVILKDPSRIWSLSESASLIALALSDWRKRIGIFLPAKLISPRLPMKASPIHCEMQRPQLKHLSLSRWILQPSAIIALIGQMDATVQFLQLMHLLGSNLTSKSVESHTSP